MKSTNVIGGLLAGAAIGVAIGMLLSPATKQRLMKGTRKLADSAEDVENLQETFNRGVDQITTKGKQVIDAASSKVKL